MNLVQKNNLKNETLSSFPRHLGGWIPGTSYQTKSVISHQRLIGAGRRRKLIEEPLNPLQFLFYMQCIELSFKLILEKLQVASFNRNKKVFKFKYIYN